MRSIEKSLYVLNQREEKKIYGLDSELNEMNIATRSKALGIWDGVLSKGNPYLRYTLGENHPKLRKVRHISVNGIRTPNSAETLFLS